MFIEYNILNMIDLKEFYKKKSYKILVYLLHCLKNIDQIINKINNFDISYFDSKLAYCI